MAWVVTVRDSVITDLRWFDKKTGRLILDEAERILSSDPLSATRHLKTLRRNPVAHRHLRVLGRYRVLFNVYPEERKVSIVVVGEKRGDRLLVQGQVFRAHHEGRTAK